MWTNPGKIWNFILCVKLANSDNLIGKLFFLIEVVIYFTYHKIHSFKLYSSVSFSNNSGSSDGKESVCNAGGLGSILG